MPRVSMTLLDWLQREQASGGVLTDSVPGAPLPIQRWLGPRLIWWPRGIPPGQRVGLVSSRLGNLSTLGSHWFAALRRICCDLRAEGQVLVTAHGTALAEILDRCSQLFHLPLMLFELARPTWSFERWQAECLARSMTELRREGECWPAIVSPPWSAGDDGLIPAQDALVVAASERIIACRVRRNGNIHRLLEQRLREARSADDPRVSLVVGEGFVEDRVARDLVARGAQCLRSAASPAVPVSAARTAIRACELSPPVLAMDDIPLADYVTHCTRAADGPWPDQDRAAYFDSLILDLPDAPHSALATLTRIVRQRRLLATSRAIRGGTPVVCFTAASVRELRHLRTFRAHRRRWDFEPYGIGVARSWLQQRGGRPVMYGDEAQWDSLAVAQRPFFQRRLCGKGGTLDWSVEREWRHVGDVDLADLPTDAGFVFVPSESEARQLSGLSRWPVVVLP